MIKCPIVPSKIELNLSGVKRDLHDYEINLEQQNFGLNNSVFVLNKLFS